MSPCCTECAKWCPIWKRYGRGSHRGIFAVLVGHFVEAACVTTGMTSDAEKVRKGGNDFIKAQQNSIHGLQAAPPCAFFCASVVTSSCTEMLSAHIIHYYAHAIAIASHSDCASASDATALLPASSKLPPRRGCHVLAVRTVRMPPHPSAAALNHPTWLNALA